MKKHNATTPIERKSQFNQNRDSYLDESGNYIYTRQVKRANGKWEREIVATVPFTDETRDIIIFLDANDHGIDLQERYDEENADYSFRNKQTKQSKQHSIDVDEEFDSDPIEAIPDPTDMLSEMLNSVPAKDDPVVEKLTEFIHSQLSEEQQNLFYAHCGQRMFLEDIRREEEALTGKKVSKQAVHKRWNRILSKICKQLGVEKPKQIHKKSDRQ